MSNQINYWRLTAKPPRFLFVDARIAILIPPVLLHLRLWTVGLFILAALIFAVLERRGYTVPVAMRLVRLWLSSRGTGRLMIQPHPSLWRWYDRK